MGLISTITEWRDRRRESAELDRNMRRMELASLRLSNQRLSESLDFLDNYVDPRDAWNDDGKDWVPVGSAGGRWDRHYGIPFANQDEHDRIRSYCRMLAHENEFAIGILETRVSYIVGTGHVYKPEAKEDGEEIQDADKLAVGEVIDAFIKANDWHSRQQEIQLRLDRDGECFLRFFDVDGEPDPDNEGKATKTVKVRFVEPSQVRTPVGEDRPNADFGILTEPEDVETVLSYFIDGQLVDAKDIQHRKRNVDRNCKRGLSLLYPSRKNLPRAEKIIRNAAATVEIQAAVGMVRRHAAATQSAVQSFVAGKADVRSTVQKPAGGGTKTVNFQQFAPGTIIDAPTTSEYEFPAIGIDPSKPGGVVQMVLRATGSRSCLPEFMVSGDASNANYASTLVAEGPAVKKFHRDQWTLIEEDIAVFDRVLALAAESGQLGKDVLGRVKVCAEPPNVIARDELQGAQKNQILALAGVLSTQTWCLQEGLDYEKEQANQEEHVERTGGSMVRAQMPGDIPVDDEDEDEDDEGGDGEKKPGEKKVVKK